ncbi:PRC-barrel domain-containing protein [Thalassococcus sp. BH17M4-6]|uniref:PRC-barrel domain-containing protein n=1 Tax=Thalassococcus sp. BH17M4-6 TaxID=3413148 RepID=UPI003BBCB7F8
MIRFATLATAAILAAVTAGPSFAQDPELEPFTTVPESVLTPAQKASSIIGAKAIANEDDSIGTVSDVVLDWKDPARVVGYIVDAGGFLGLDSAHVFVPIDSAKVRVDGRNIDLIVDIDAAIFRADAKLD